MQAQPGEVVTGRSPEHDFSKSHVFEADGAGM